MSRAREALEALEDAPCPAAHKPAAISWLSAAWRLNEIPVRLASLRDLGSDDHGAKRTGCYTDPTALAPAAVNVGRLTRVEDHHCLGSARRPGTARRANATLGVVHVRNLFWGRVSQHLGRCVSC